MIHLCERCHASFAVVRGRQRYCPPCTTLMLTRVCARPTCGKKFSVGYLTSPQQYCDNVCQREAVYAKKRQARTLFRCALGDDCPRPDDLIPKEPSRAEGKHYHPECLKTFLRSGDQRRGAGQGSVVAVCQICHHDIGLRRLSSRPVKYHRACYDRRRGESLSRVGRQREGAEHPCTECGTLVYRPPHASGAKAFFCTVACRIAWRRGRGKGLWRTPQARSRLHVTCTECSDVREFVPSTLPRSIDRERMTWMCLSCRRKQNEWKTLRCDYAACRIVFKRFAPRRQNRQHHFCSQPHHLAWLKDNRLPKIRLTCAYCQIEAAAGKRPHDDICFELRRSKVRNSKHHFCSLAHVALYSHEQRRRRRLCQQCGEIIERKGPDVLFCTDKCYRAWRRGRSTHHRGTEEKIIAAWQNGVRGVRALARASETSVNTVQKVLRSGKLSKDVAMSVASSS